MRLQQVMVDGVEALGCDALTVEELDHRDARDVFGDRRVDTGELDAHRAERLAHALADEVGHHEQWRNDQERHERQLPAQQQQGGGDADDRYGIAEDSQST